MTIYKLIPPDSPRQPWVIVAIESDGSESVEYETHDPNEAYAYINATEED